MFCHTSFLLETSENFQTNWWLECKVFFFQDMPSCHLIYYIYSYLVHVIQCSGGVCFQLNLYIMTYVFMTSDWVPGANDDLTNTPRSESLNCLIFPWLETCKIHTDVSLNSGTPKSSILIGFSIITHPFWGTPIFGNTHIFFAFFGWFLLHQHALRIQDYAEISGPDGIGSLKKPL